MTAKPEIARDRQVGRNPETRSSSTSRQLFPLGRDCLTANAQAVLGEQVARSVPLDEATRALAAQSLAANYCLRHGAGDWGDLSPDDRRSNLEALEHGDRIFSSYNLPGGGRIWVITEWDRSLTTVLLPEDY